jgi:hypothetical protein
LHCQKSSIRTSHPRTRFVMDQSGAFLANTCYFLPSADFRLLSYLNSKVAWFVWRAITNIARGGFLRLRTDFVEKTPIPEFRRPLGTKMGKLGQDCSAGACERFELEEATRRRILDLAPPDRRKLSRKLEEWWELDFPGFLDEVKRTFKADVPLRQRGEWEAYLAENRATVQRLTTEIKTAEREIDAIVYRLFDLTREEIALLEASLEGQY